MKLVIVESPFAGAGDPTEVVANVTYARACCKYGLIERGESGWGSHMIWPQFLDDTDQDERLLGISAGLAWSRVADYHVFYTDRGWSRGMLAALGHCIEHQRPFRLRSIYGALPQMPPASWLEGKAHVKDLILCVREIYP